MINQSTLDSSPNVRITSYLSKLKVTLVILLAQAIGFFVFAQVMASQEFQILYLFFNLKNQIIMNCIPTGPSHSSVLHS